MARRAPRVRGGRREIGNLKRKGKISAFGALQPPATISLIKGLGPDTQPFYLCDDCEMLFKI